LTAWHIREAVRQIAAGGVIAYPTETVYGLGCDPLNGGAVLRVLELKRRDPEQGVILIASQLRHLESLLQPLTPASRMRLMRAGSEPVTWTLPCLPEVPRWLRGVHTTLAVRLTRHPLARALCEGWDGPLVSTSANRHGGHPVTSALAVRRVFGASLDFVLHGECGSGRPSAIRDGISGRILRKG
jgi:L-threonylcarbamoyladenylate synthase